MLSDVDARLVEGDPSVPGMATLLDNEAFADILIFRDYLFHTTTKPKPVT